MAANVIDTVKVCGRTMNRVKCRKCNGVFVDAGTIRNYVPETCVDCSGRSASRGVSAWGTPSMPYADVQYHG